ncbi:MULTISPECIES: DUF1127 domain-containing protein [Pseudomonas]|uniref:DUF1127 domain-containing protein n=1 Tax=Pseudomonas TaxID=286 RepID=UPI002579FDA3|nr:MULTISPECIES: hypothetical protein [Pseudomonas]
MKGQRGFVLVAKRPFSRVLNALCRWHERQLLVNLSDDALKDIGLNRVDVEHERRLPVWQDPLRK